MSKVKHEQVVHVIEIGKNYIAMEYMPGGDLMDFITFSGPLKENLARYVFKQILSGLHHLHSKNMSHLDVKCENILVDTNFKVKLADFGFSSDFCENLNKDSSEFFKNSLVGTV